MKRDVLFFVDSPVGMVWLRYHTEQSSRIQLMRDEEGLGSYHSASAAANAAATGATSSDAVNTLPPGTIPAAIERWQRGPL